MCQAKRIAQLENFIIAEFDDPIARRAVQVVVAGGAIVMLKRAAVREAKLAQEARLDQQAQGAVNRRPAHLVPRIVQVAYQLVSVKVLMRVKDMTDDHPAGLRQFLFANFQELTEFFNRRLGVDQGCQSITLHFRPDSESRSVKHRCTLLPPVLERQESN
jgi:hypothetical protein